MPTPNHLITTVAEFAELLDALAIVLKQEQGALQDNATDAVVSVTGKKQALLQQINETHPDVIYRLTEQKGDSETPTIERVKSLMSLCKRYNNENATLVAHGLKMCRRSMHFLHGNVNQSIERYNPDGHTTSTVSCRNIGTA